MADSSKRVCLVIPSLAPGGMERVMSLLAAYFVREKNLEIHLVLFGRKREIFYEIPKIVKVHKPNFIFDNSKRTLYTLKTIHFLRSEIQKIDPEVILSFGEEWNNLFLLSQLGKNYPIYVADRAQPGLKRNKMQEFLTKWLYTKAKGIIVQTEIARKIYEDKYNHPSISVIGNPIQEINSTHNNVKRENIILSVGRLIDTKHFDLLIKIFKQLNATNWKLVIIGGDSQKQNLMENLQELITDLKLENSVTLTGTVPNVEDYYRKSKIFAFTSSSEGFPNVVGEALSAGLPVVSFDCVAGPSDLIDDGKNGFLVPLFATDLFKEKLLSLMQNENMRIKMSKEAKKSVERFTGDTMKEKFYHLINNNEK